MYYHENVNKTLFPVENNIISKHFSNTDINRTHETPLKIL